jgi:N-methylhydantoinase A
MIGISEKSDVEYTIGIDTGGTFTDTVVIDGTGRVTSGKALTTPDDLASGLFSSIDEVAQRLGLSRKSLLGATRVFRFSGTTATNALLTRFGDPVGLLVTSGFEDTLHIGRAVSAWAGLSERELRRSYQQRKPPPLVPRSFIRGIDERVDQSGTVLLPIDTDQVRIAAEELHSAGVRSIAVCFLWSIRNPDHELAARRIVADVAPGMPVHCSHEVAPSVGEYERFVTTAVDAFVSPVLTRSLASLRERLAESGFEGQLLIAQADGGCLYPDDARPVSTLQSGPAAGVIASQVEAAKLGRSNVVTTDVGGTSFDVGLVADGRWMYAREPELGRLNLSVPMIEVASVGAGGGSIGWVDEVGILHVGPRSAGSSPGPACYDRGGREPTVTDADLLLGYLDPDTGLGGRVALSYDAAVAAMERVADQAGLDVIEAAAGIFEIVNSHMGDLLTRQIVARGYDPRDFVIFAYGGAGPMHSAFYGAECGAQEVIVPSLAGTFSALGVAVAPLLHTAREPTFAAMPMSADEYNEILGVLDDTVVAALDKDGVADQYREITCHLEMRYGRQVHTVRFQVPRGQADDESLRDLCLEFDRSYERLYGAGSGYPKAGRYITAFAVEGRGNLPVPVSALEPTVSGENADRALFGARDAWFDGGFRQTYVYRYELLRSGDELRTPAIVEADQTTIVVPPGRSARLDQHGNFRLSGLVPSTMRPAFVGQASGGRRS